MGHSQEGSYMAILIRRSKTDQEGSGSKVFVQAQPSLGYLCPVFITQRYFRSLGYEEKGHSGHLQPRMRMVGGEQQPILNTKICYSNALADMREVMSVVDGPAGRYGEHSRRRGGATAALA